MVKLSAPLVLLSLLSLPALPVWGSPISSLSERALPPSTLRFPIRRQASSLAKRSEFLSSTLYNDNLYYIIDVGVGTPPQSLLLSLDTGSSDTWVLAPEGCTGECSAACEYHLFIPRLALHHG